MTHESTLQSSPAIADLLDSVHLAPRQAHKRLCLWPLVLREGAVIAGAAYVSLADALAERTLHVDEVSEGGAVPLVRVRNRGDRAVLVLFGEELRGAKQNRIANASFLIRAKGEIRMDVSCVEQGRWGAHAARRGAPAGFESSASLVSHELRRRMGRSVSAARAAGLGFRADQGEVWHEVGLRLEDSRTRSDTAAYADYAATRATDLREIRAAFRPLERQIGFAAVLGDAVAGVEVIGRPEVFASCFERLVDAYAIDAIDAPSHPAGEPRFSEPEALLDALRAASVRAAPSLGLGRDLRIEGAGLEGCALGHEGIVHLVAYPALEEVQRPRREGSPDGWRAPRFIRRMLR